MNAVFRIVGLLLPLSAFTAPGPAAAEIFASETYSAENAGLDLRISAEKAEFRPGEPVRLTFEITNGNNAACDLAATDAATVRVISLRRDGQELRSTLARSFYVDGIHGAIATSLRTVQPGSAVRVAVNGFRMGEGDAAGGVVISSVTAMQDGGGLAALWPVGEPGRYELTATYAVPESGGRWCTGSTAAATVAFTVGEEDSGLPTWVLTGGVALAVLALGGLAAVLLRRRAGRAAAGAVVVLTIAGTAVLAGPSLVARADIEIDPWGGPLPSPTAENPFPETDFSDQARACIGKLRKVAAGSSNAAKTVGEVLDRLGRKKVRIVPTNGGSRADGRSRGPAVIQWNPATKGNFTGENVPFEKCAALYHELFHADGILRGEWPTRLCGPDKVPEYEVTATWAESDYREAVGLPRREKHDGRRLPTSLDECEGDPDAKGPGGICGAAAQECAGSYGDPHLMTFDQLHYGFQAVGEFVLTRGAGMEVQARQAPFAGWSRAVSVTAALAFRVGERRLNLVFGRSDIEARIDGTAVDLERGEHALPGGGTLVRQPSSSGFGTDDYVVRWPDGSAAQVDRIGTWGLRLVMKLDRGRIGGVTGLYGDFDGDPANDLVPAGGGTPLGPEPEFEPKYRVFGESWRVRDDTSLFDYGSGERTETFTDRSFPDRDATVDSLDPERRAEAEWICREAGVTNAAMFADCVVDVAVTGQPDFAVAGADAEITAPPAYPVTAPPVAAKTLVIDRPGGTDRLTFTGKAGQEVFVDLGASTVPDPLCGKVRLLAPSGKSLASGCVSDGSGFLRRTKLPAAGEYAVELAPGGTATGRMLVRVYEAVDKTGSITPDGPTKTVTITHPGSVGKLTFAGHAGQTVFVDAPRSSLPNRCEVLLLLGPDGKKLNTGCVFDGDGYIDATPLDADGRYTVVVDPTDRFIGETQLRLVVVHDQSGSIAVNGSPVRATVREPGGTSGFEFRGRAGQQLQIETSERTLPDECKVIAVVGPGDKKAPSACPRNGASVREATLPADGVYRVTVDPPDRATGAITLRLLGG